MIDKESPTWKAIEIWIAAQRIELQLELGSLASTRERDLIIKGRLRQLDEIAILPAETNPQNFPFQSTPII